MIGGDVPDPDHVTEKVPAESARSATEKIEAKLMKSPKKPG